MPQKSHPTVSIIIKALNEERHIASAIESARRYPIKIVQLNDIVERSCGAGAQLGFQYSSGRYLCLIDGDMQLHGDFLPAALQFLDGNSTVAGVGGFVIDREISNLEF